MDNEEQQIRRPNKKIFNYACAILARRRNSISEFRSKLGKKFPDQLEETVEIIELFIDRKYLDDKQYATSFIQEQLRRKPQGLRLIMHKLRQKGISETTLSSTFREQLIDEDELVQQAVAKKIKTLSGASLAVQKQKIYRFLASRGFNQENIFKALSTLKTEE